LSSQISSRLLRLWLSLALIAASTFICYVAIHANATTAGFVFLVGILVIAATWGLIEALVASGAAMLCFNYFFLPPVGRLAIADPQNWAALLTFLATALIASHLSDRARKEAHEAKRRQQETERLYELSRVILLTGTARHIYFQVAQNLARIFECRSVAIYDPETATISYGGQQQLPEIEARLKQVLTATAPAQDPASDVMIAGIAGSGRALGSLAMAGISLSDNALQALLKLVAIALEGARTQQAATHAEAVRQSEEFKSTLLDAIAHEFKTPLTSIKVASTSILTDVPDLSPQVRELTSIIDEEASRLNLLVTDAVRMAQMDASKIQLEKQPVAVAEFVGRVLEDFRPRLNGRSLRVNLSQTLPRIAADPDLASMALRQVIDNGFKYSLPASAIEVAADASAEWVTIRVRDQGPGIPKRESERIFDRFYRRRVAKDRVPGSGLGLYIAREIVRAHGGDLWVESVVGSGSEFCLMLPAQEEPVRS
jgi:two-component system sensor histidine kinase KdpD